MYAVIGRVRLKPGREQEAQAMISERGVAMLQGMAGSAGGYWARTLGEDESIQHSFWLFDTDHAARGAEETFNALRHLPDAPAEFISVDVCEVIGHAPRPSPTDA